MNNVGCVGCHQLGQESTRTIPAELGQFKSGAEAWMRRIQSGQSGELMINRLAGQFGGVPFKYFGDWTDRVAKGELPKAKPPRPQGVERNIVVTSWEWSTREEYLHDLISSDRRNPTVNAYGPLYGSPEYATDNMPILDPKTNKVTFFKMPVRDPNMPESLGPGHAAAVKPLQPSPYWGDEKIWDTRANNHNAMFDKKGRVWLAATVRGMDNPAFCKKGSEHPSAKVFPLDRSPRQVAVLDPKTMKYTFVDTCFGTHHPQFGYDADDTLWLSGTGPVAGWVNTKMFDETGDAAEVAGLVAVHPRHQRQRQARRLRRAQPAGRSGQGQAHRSGLGTLCGDAAPDRRLGLVHRRRVRRRAGLPALRSRDRAVGSLQRAEARLRHPRRRHRQERRAWGSASSGQPRELRPPQVQGAAQRAERDRRPLPGRLGVPPVSGPGLRRLSENSAEASYYTWVDQHNTFGLGENIPMSTANLNDGFVALKDGKMVMIRIPYPMGFYAKGFDGRIDDPNAGWKGRGLWSTSGDRTPWLMEGGKGSKPRAVHIQLRPDPLAR